MSHDGFVWADDNSSCTIRACCGLCDEIFEYTHTPAVTTTEATCVASGKTVYSVSFRDLSDSKEVILPIDESNHDYVDGVCTRCGEKLYPSSWAVFRSAMTTPPTSWETAPPPMMPKPAPLL